MVSSSSRLGLSTRGPRSSTRPQSHGQTKEAGAENNGEAVVNVVKHQAFLDTGLGHPFLHEFLIQHDTTYLKRLCSF